VPRNIDDIIASLQHDSALSDDPIVEAAPELDEPTPAPSGNLPHSAQAAAERRRALAEVTPPTSASRNAKDRLRDATIFAIIAKLLAFNATNAEIVEGLANAGHPMAERTLQRIMKREDFVRYYEAFQGDAKAKVIKLLEDVFTMAAPEAYNHLVRLMRNGKSSETQRQAANDILKYAGFGRQDGSKSLHIHLPPEMARALAVEGEKVVSSTIRALQTGPKGVERGRVIDVEATEAVDEAPNPR
jgi:hypothetical protein